MAPMAVAGPMVFTKVMYDEIDKAISSIKKVSSDQLFVGGRLDLLWKQVEAQTNVAQVHGAALQQLQDAATPATPTGPCMPCGVGVLGAIGVPTGEAAAPKPTDDGSVMSATLLKVIGGNGQCHCVHVGQLIKQVAALEARPTSTPLRADAPAYGASDPFSHSDPWQPAGAGGAGGANGSGSGDGPGDGSGPGGHGNQGQPGFNRDGMPRDARGKLILPLLLREHIGSAGYKDKPMFDEKHTERDEYRYAGKSGTGLAWKGKVERHFISRAPG